MTLRSSSLSLLTVPTVFSKSCLAYGDRALCFAIPREWDKLPELVRKAQTVESFKKNLKKYRFNL